MRMDFTKYGKYERNRLNIHSGLVTAVQGSRVEIYWIKPNGTPEVFAVDLYGDKPESGDLVDFRRFNVSPTCICCEVKGKTPDEFMPLDMLARMDVNVLQCMQKQNPAVYDRVQSLAEQQPG